MKKTLFIFPLFLLYICFIYTSYPVQKLNDFFPILTKERKLVSWREKPPESWMRRSKIEANLIWPIIVNEDATFYLHKGISYKEIIRSLVDYFIEDKKLRGASTISMQVARNLFLNHKRSFYRKFKEAIIAKKIENNLDKDKILEVYLNIIEFAPGVHGIKDALKFYFPRTLKYNLKHGAYLAQALPNPRDFGKKSPNSISVKRMEKIINKLRVNALINKNEEQKLNEIGFENKPGS